MDSIVGKAICIQVSMFHTSAKLSLLLLRGYEKDETRSGCNFLSLVFMDEFWFGV